MKQIAGALNTARPDSGREPFSSALLINTAFFRQLNERGVRYCHWKSNWMLADALAGKTDLDVLVHRQDATKLRAILLELGFQPAAELDTAPVPSVEHYYAIDDASCAIVHLHVYYRVISGDSLTKSYRLPLEEMLLSNVTRCGSVDVPSRGAELVVFVLRMSVKHATLPELSLLLRDWEAVEHEVDWLVTKETRDEAADLLSVWLPSVNGDAFANALDSILMQAPLWRRVILGRRLRKQLRPFARQGRVKSWFGAWRAFADSVTHRLRGSRRRRSPTGGGAIVAFVGSEATGKSTTIEDIERWLGKHYAVERIHAGKPPSTYLTFLPNLLLPAARRLMPKKRSTAITMDRVSGRENGAAKESFPLLFGFRSVLLAYDRRALLRRAYASSSNGTVVLCDRYPSAESGAPDSAQLDYFRGGGGGGMRQWLAELEGRLYRDISSPDLVVSLTAPLEVTLERNRARAKTEPEEHVLARHARGSNLQFKRTQVETIDTNRPRNESMREIRRLIWQVL